MISIIICSRNEDITNELKLNIQTTIGVDYELIVIDNSKNKYSIFSAYNKGVKEAKYPFLCFMHEDILYHTNEWGKKAICHLTNPQVGIIGVAGGHFMPNSPAGWFSSDLSTINIIQSYYENGIKTTYHDKKFDYLERETIEVVAVDGVWFCMPKSLFTSISFDDKNFKGFHCYDLDICLQARSTGNKVLVVTDILLEHFSGGKTNNEWIENSIIIHNKWKQYLPQIAGIHLTSAEIKSREKFVREIFYLTIDLYKNQSELAELRHSNAFRLGNIILRPFSALRNVFLK